MNYKERLKYYLDGYSSQYNFKDENDIEHDLDSDIEEMLKQNQKLEQALDENNKLKIQISARETLCEEYEQLINTILNFPFFKEECPLNFGFEDNSKEDKAQNIFYNDEYCENNCNNNYKDCWLKYFKELQKAKGDVKNENN